MRPKEIERKRERLVKIISNSDSEHSKYAALKELGKEVGVIAPLSLSVNNEDETSSVEIADKIQTALQTAAMIDICRTANRNFVIALIASTIALGSAVALWVAVCK